MNSRDRVKRALAHQEPDRVPVDLWGSASRLDNEFYSGLINHLGFKDKGERLRPGTATEYVDYRISDIVGSDFRQINIGAAAGYKGWVNEDGHSINEWGYGKKTIGKYPTVTYHPLEEAEMEDLDRYPWPKAEDPGRIQGLVSQARDWYEAGFAITATSAVSGQFFDNAQYLRGTENFLTDLYLNKSFAHKLIEKINQTLIEINLYYLKPIAPYIEWVELSSDLGMQQGPFVSPQIFREFFKQPFKELFGAIKRTYPNVKVFLHSCGAIYDYIPDLIDAGLDILNPLQPLAAGMDSYRLKKEFGKELVLHGGIDIQQAMIGSLSDVETEVKTRLDAFAPSGGYILAPCNHIQPDVPCENFLHMYHLAKEYGKYPLVPYQ